MQYFDKKRAPDKLQLFMCKKALLLFISLVLKELVYVRHSVAKSLNLPTTYFDLL